MSTRSAFRTLGSALAISSVIVRSASAAPPGPPSGRQSWTFLVPSGPPSGRQSWTFLVPSGAVVTVPDSVARADSMLRGPTPRSHQGFIYPPSTPVRISRTPGPLLPPGSPIVDRTTIVPFPIPGDTSPMALTAPKNLNVPRPGLTLTEPLAPTPPLLDELRYVMKPRSLVDVVPVYPDSARKAKVEGTVMVSALVRGDGSVAETRILSSIPLLDAAAMDAVRKMRFAPATNPRSARDVWVIVPVQFKLH